MQPQYLSGTACDSKTFDAKQPTKIDTELASVRVVVDGRRTSVVGPLHAFADWSQAQKCKQEMRRRAHACLPVPMYFFLHVEVLLISLEL